MVVAYYARGMGRLRSGTLGQNIGHNLAVRQMTGRQVGVDPRLARQELMRTHYAALSQPPLGEQPPKGLFLWGSIRVETWRALYVYQLLVTSYLPG